MPRIAEPGMHPAPPIDIDEIVRLILNVVVQPDAKSPRPSIPCRQIAARRAFEYVDAHAADAPSVCYLAKIAGVGERALEYGFREIYGLTPKTCIQARRLNGVRNALRRAEPGSVLIADIANDWGFWHMGQLAKDYRSFFGELPSETLAVDVERRTQTCGFSMSNACGCYI